LNELKKNVSTRVLVNDYYTLFRYLVYCVRKFNISADMEIINSLKGDLSYVYIINNYSHEELVALIKADQLEAFLNTLCQIITDQNITALVIDNIFPVCIFINT